MDLKVNIEGLKGIEDALQGFAPKIVRKGFREAMQAAEAPQIAAAKANAPRLKKPHKGRRPGELSDSIVGTVKLSKRGASGRVGPKRNKGEGKQAPGAWGLMVEFGSIHGPAQAYLRPAFDSTKDQAVDAFAASLRTTVESTK